MNNKRFLGAASAALMIVIAILTVAPSTLAQSKFKTLHKFTGGKDGGRPVASLIFDAAGDLYGTTWGGGNSGCIGTVNCGVVFELTPSTDGSWKEKVLHRFTGGMDGANPAANLIFDAAGSLYGTAELGGIANCADFSKGCGTVFRLTPNADGSWKETVIDDFGTLNYGNEPAAGLIFDRAANLYGTTIDGGTFICYQGCGVVFELTPSTDGTWTEEVLHNFNNSDDGVFPFAGLISDAAGNLYGTTQLAGAYNAGIVFELTPSAGGSWSESILYNFTGGKDGGEPFAGLTFDQAGNLYGTTAVAGNLKHCKQVFVSGCGVVFKLTPNAEGSWTESVLHVFTGGRDGGNPYAGLIFDQAGNLYGTTTSGGTHGYGVVFKLVPNTTGGWNETVLHAFADHLGANPDASLIFDAFGNLYGTTAGDGTTTFGSVFEITP